MAGSIGTSYAADLNDQFYQVMDEADANPITLNTKEDDKNFISRYTKLNQKLASINQQRTQKFIANIRLELSKIVQSLKLMGLSHRVQPIVNIF